MGGVTSGEGGSFLDFSKVRIESEAVVVVSTASRCVPSKEGSDRGLFAIAADILRSPGSLRSVPSVFGGDDICKDER